MSTSNEVEAKSQIVEIINESGKPFLMSFHYDSLSV